MGEPGKHNRPAISMGALFLARMIVRKGTAAEMYTDTHGLLR